MPDSISPTICLQRFSHFPVFLFLYLRARANVHAPAGYCRDLLGFSTSSTLKIA